MKVLDANKLVPALQFTNNGCSMVACIQSVFSEINYHIRTTMNAGKNATKIIKVEDANKLVPAIKFTSIGCSMIACIQSVSSEISEIIQEQQ